MGSYSDAKFPLNSTSVSQQQDNVNDEPASQAKIIPGRRRSRSSGIFSSNPLRIFTNTSSPPTSFVSSSSLPQSRGLPISPIDSELFPEPLNSPPDDDNSMYKIPGQNVYIVPYGSSPMGSHPAWSGYNSAPAQPTYQPFPQTNYYPGQARQPYEDIHSTSRDRQKYVPNSGYDTDSYEDGALDLRAYASDGDRRRSRRWSRSNLFQPAPPPGQAQTQMEFTQYDPRSGFRPPQSVSPSNSASTDESGRSSAASYTSMANGLNRSVRWRENLVAPTPPPSAPRPKGWFNRRGDQLWCNDGRYRAAVEEYPHYLRDYPDVGEGWMNEHGVRISMTHRRVSGGPSRQPKGVLKNAGNPLAI